MADFSALKTSIQNYIKENGNEEITGNLLQQILLSMVTTLGDSAINDLVTALNAEIANRGNADTTLQGNINSEAAARGNADTELGGRITTLQGVVNGIKANVENGYVYAGIATPSTTPASGKVFYLALTAGTYTNFGATVVPQGINILKYNGQSWSLDSFLGLDDAPTQGSPNLVKSGGINISIQNAVNIEKTRALQAEAILQQSIINEKSRAINAENNLHEEVLVEKNERKQEIVGVRDDVLSLIHDYQPIVIEGNVVNAPDEEDITQEPNNLLKFKDKAYNPTIFSGLGKKYLRKNVLINEDYISFDGFVINPQTEDVLEGVPDAVLWDRLREKFVAQKDEKYYLDWQGSSFYIPVDGDKIYVNENIPYFWNGEDLAVDDNVIERYGNTLTQEMFSEENTVYIIKYDYTLCEDITIPANCVLEFDGGSISGYSITGIDIKILNGHFIDTIVFPKNGFLIQDSIFENRNRYKCIICNEENDRNNNVYINNCVFIETGKNLSEYEYSVSPIDIKYYDDCIISNCVFDGVGNNNLKKCFFIYNGELPEPDSDPYIYHFGTTRVLNCTFKNFTNSGIEVQHDGGLNCIVSTHNDETIVDNCVFEDIDIQGYDAEGIYTKSKNTIISNCSFKNTSFGGEGALCIKTGTIQAVNNDIETDSLLIASVYGGGFISNNKLTNQGWGICTHFNGVIIENNIINLTYKEHVIHSTARSPFHFNQVVNGQIVLRDNSINYSGRFGAVSLTNFRSCTIKEITVENNNFQIDEPDVNHSVLNFTNDITSVEILSSDVNIYISGNYFKTIGQIVKIDSTRIQDNKLSVFFNDNKIQQLGVNTCVITDVASEKKYINSFVLCRNKTYNTLQLFASLKASQIFLDNNTLTLWKMFINCVFGYVKLSNNNIEKSTIVLATNTAITDFVIEGNYINGFNSGSLLISNEAAYVIGSITARNNTVKYPGLGSSSPIKYIMDEPNRCFAIDSINTFNIKGNTYYFNNILNRLDSRGPSNKKPQYYNIGDEWFDLTNSKPIYKTESGWVDATGATV